MHKFKNHKLILISLVFGLISYKIQAQIYNFRNLNVQHGMAQSQIQSIVQDDQGNIWFGTLGGGVTLYNGLELNTFTTKEGLIDNTVSSLIKLSDGTIWLGTSSGISRYVPPQLGIADASKASGKSRKGRFINYEVRHGLVDTKIESMMEDKLGNVWFGSNRGLWMMPKVKVDSTKDENYSFNGKKLFKKFSKKDGLPDTSILTMIMDDMGNLYFGTRLGLARMNYRESQIDGSKVPGLLLYFDVLTEKHGLQSKYIITASKDNIGMLWFTTITGISKLDPFATSTTKKAVIQNFIADTLTVYSMRRVQDFKQDTKGNFWFTTLDRGAYYLSLNESSNKLDKIDHLTLLNGLAMNDLTTQFEDREGNIWFGSNGAGAIEFTGRAFETFTPSEGLGEMYVFPIEEDAQGRIWFGTNYNGMSVYDPNKQGEVKGKFSNFGSESGFPKDIIRDIMVDRNKNLWFGNRYGAYRLSPNKFLDGDKKMIPFFFNKKTKLNPSVNELFEDSKGNIWFSTSFEGIRIMPPDFKYTDSIDGNKLYVLDKKSGYSLRAVRQIFEDKWHNIWITSDEGVAIIKNGTELLLKPKVTYIRKEDGLTNNRAFGIVQDKKDNIWIGTISGVSKISFDQSEFVKNGKKAFTFQNFSTEHGLSSDLVYLNNLDNEGNIWFGTNKGIDQYMIDRGTFRNYGKAEGFTGIETNSNSSLRDSKGNLWFGTVNGVIKYNPSELKINAAQPITTITKLRIFFKDFEIPTDHIFKYFQNYMTFDFVAVSLTVPEKVRYQWKLEGFDDDWLPETRETRVTYSNIPHGEYIFKVRACNNSGLWNDVPASFRFIITPPFWKTWWFYTLSIASIIGLFYAYVKIREKKLLQEKLILETKVAERTAELADKNKKITQSINYAKRIQSAILPADKYVKEFLPHSFIYYKPRDIVSGDFYWFQKIEYQGKPLFIIAAADCTGHGVPGALMSIVGFNLLNHSLDHAPDPSPANILDKLNDGLSNIFKAGETNGKVRDGMDISICSFDMENLSVQFAGAHQPLYVVRDGKILVTNANRFPIGRYFEGVNTEFTNHEVQLQKDDVIYIFSDGYVDQFGGPENRKFMRHRFQDLLIAIHQLPMKEQQAKLNSTIDEWLGTNRQIDDILVIGVRI